MSNLPFLNEVKLQACIKENPKIEAWLPVFEEHLPKYNINTPERVAGFLSQTAYESNYYRTFTENLNYSEARLLVIFKKYFNAQTAKQYARKPEAIANRVYANRLGNGPESSGDGWKFRGRGAIQTTGKSNYGECSEFLFNDRNILLDKPELLAQTNGIVQSAIWYWVTRDLNELADKRDVKAMTLRINGGTHGLSARTVLFNRMIAILD